MDRQPAIKSFQSASGDVIYRLTLEAFYDFWTYVYLVLTADNAGREYKVLIDTGSGYGRSNDDLMLGLKAVAERDHRFSGTDDLTHILITHGHIDHFGGLPYLRDHTSAPVGIHALDRTTVTNFDQRLESASKTLTAYLFQAGLDGEEVDKLIQIYRASKLTYQDTPVDYVFDGRETSLGPFQLLHVPGHCPGHVVIRLDDVLFSGDHVLPMITPHQAPECLTLNTGLDHYLASLQELKAWANGIHLTLPGHEGEVNNLAWRIAEIDAMHRERFQCILDFLAAPHTVNDTAQKLFGEVHGYQGYNRLLAIEEAGAHVEYLSLRGLIHIDNFTEVQAARQPIPVYYRTTQ